MTERFGAPKIDIHYFIECFASSFTGRGSYFRVDNDWVLAVLVKQKALRRKGLAENFVLDANS